MVIDWIHQIQYTGTALIMSMDEDGAEKKKTWRVAPCDAISHINIIIECLLDLFWLPVTAMTVHLRVYRCRTVWSVSPWIGGLKIDPCAEVGPFFFSFFFSTSQSILTNPDSEYLWKVWQDKLYYHCEVPKLINPASSKPERTASSTSLLYPS